MQRREGSESHLALGASTFAFTVCFAVWTIFSINGVRIKQDLGLNDTEFGILVATPILTGSLSRIFLGIWTDQRGGRIVFTVLMAMTAVATWMLSTVTTYTMFLVAALGVGLAGGSFAVGIAFVSRWYDRKHQGTALGMFGIGNVGAAVTNFGAPFLLVAFGWERAAQVYAVVLFVTAILFFLVTREDPVTARRKASGEEPRSTFLQIEPLKRLQVWRFSLYYFFVFGSFIGYAATFALATKVVFGFSHMMVDGMMTHDTVNPNDPSALTYAWMGPFIGALIRPVGGTISDRMGGAKVTQIVSVVMVASALGVAWVLELAYASATPEQYFVPFLLLFLVLFAATGIGNGSTFRTIAVVFDREQAGPVLGWTSAVAAYGAFVIPKVFGEPIRATTPEYALYGFALFYAVCILVNWWFYLRPNAYVRNP